jgi:hypothetical protein
MFSKENGLEIVVSVVMGVIIYVTVKKTAELSKKAYRRLRPAK